MLQELICSLLLLMNLAILWDSPTQMSVEPWCTLSTHMWTQKPSHFIGMIGEEFRNYTVNTLDFQDKAYQCIGFTTLPDCRGFLVLPKRKKGENLRGGKKKKPCFCILNPLYLFCNMPPLPPRADEEAMQQPGTLSSCTPVYCQTYVLWTLLCKWAISASGDIGWVQYFSLGKWYHPTNQVNGTD